MAEQSFADREKEISKEIKERKKETNRRRGIWRKMEVAARQAVRVVTNQARSHGFKNLEWFYDSTTWGELVNIRYKHCNGRGNDDCVDLVLHGDGELAYRANELDRAYRGLPNLNDRDPKLFKRKAIEHLTKSLDSYRASHEAKKK